MKRAGVFIRAYVFILLCTLSTWCVAHDHFTYVMLLSLFISLNWTMNVKSVAIGDWTDRLLYTAGAFCGTGAALLITKI